MKTQWLFLVHQVNTSNSRERVRVWRAIKKTGALLYRNSVYVLPFNKERLEDFQWVAQQINDSKGEASVFVSHAQNEREDRELRRLFQKAREDDFKMLSSSAERLLERIRLTKARQSISDRLRKKLEKQAKDIRENFEDLQKIDFFSDSPPKRVVRLLNEISSQLSFTQGHSESPSLIKEHSKSAFQKKIWTTREGLHIDRIASAWLIQRFIDPAARFVFAPEDSLPKDAIHFDVFGAEFSHHGEDCTFETLVKAFRIQDPAIRQVAEIVHDIDLKDHKFERAEVAGFDMVIRSLANSQKNDHRLLEISSLIFDALYQSFSSKSVKQRK